MLPPTYPPFSWSSQCNLAFTSDHWPALSIQASRLRLCPVYISATLLACHPLYPVMNHIVQRYIIYQDILAQLLFSDCQWRGRLYNPWRHQGPHDSVLLGWDAVSLGHTPGSRNPRSYYYENLKTWIVHLYGEATLQHIWRFGNLWKDFVCTCEPLRRETLFSFKKSGTTSTVIQCHIPGDWNP